MWKVELDRSSNLRDNNERKNALVTRSCVPHLLDILKESVLDTQTALWLTLWLTGPMLKSLASGLYSPRCHNRALVCEGIFNGYFMYLLSVRRCLPTVSEWSEYIHWIHQRQNVFVNVNLCNEILQEVLGWSTVINDNIKLCAHHGRRTNAFWESLDGSLRLYPLPLPTFCI